MKKIAFVVLLIFSGTLLYAQDEFTLVKEGSKAPDFEFESSPGVTKKLSDLKGKVVWLNFFATWCPPCRQELPLLEKEVFEKYKNRPDFEIMVIGREHSWEEVNKFKTDNKYQLSFYPDPERKIFSIYAGQNIPRNFIVDKDGEISVASVGFTEEEFREMIKKVDILLQK